MHIIAVDAMGGDHAPQSTVQGSVEALRAYGDLRILLVGQEEKLAPLLQDAGDVRDRLEIVDAREVISNNESPVMAIRQKTDASLVRAFALVREGRAQALVSAGSTGAVMAGGMFRLGRIEGVERPALATPIPTAGGGQTLLLDSGANVDCQGAWIAQFARMGAVYARQVLGVTNPRVGLLNIGEEEEKGNRQTKEAGALLKETGLNYVGNVEARAIPMGEADVVACDGFAGNVALKAMEGITKALFDLLRQELTANSRTKLGAALVKPALRRIKKRMNAEEIGGVPMLGVSGAVVKAHGNSSAKAFFSAVRQAYRMLEGNVTDIIRSELQDV